MDERRWRRRGLGLRDQLACFQLIIVSGMAVVRITLQFRYDRAFGEAAARGGTGAGTFVVGWVAPSGHRRTFGRICTTSRTRGAASIICRSSLAKDARQLHIDAPGRRSYTSRRGEGSLSYLPRGGGKSRELDG